MKTERARLALLEARIERLEAELRNFGRSTPLTIPLKTAVYALYAVVAILAAAVAVALCR